MVPSQGRPLQWACRLWISSVPYPILPCFGTSVLAGDWNRAGLLRGPLLVRCLPHPGGAHRAEKGSACAATLATATPFRGSQPAIVLDSLLSPPGLLLRIFGGEGELPSGQRSGGRLWAERVAQESPAGACQARQLFQPLISLLLVQGCQLPSSSPSLALSSHPMPA